MKQSINLIRGTNKTIQIDVRSGDGTVYAIGESEVIRFGVKKTPDDTEYVYKKDLTAINFENDIYTFTIDAADTIGLDFGRYYYDVGLQSGAAYYNIIECSEFNIMHNITSAEEGE